MNSFYDSWLFLGAIVFLLTACATLLTLICVEKWRQRTRRKDVKEEVRHIRAEFEAIVDGLRAEGK